MLRWKFKNFEIGIQVGTEIFNGPGMGFGTENYRIRNLIFDQRVPQIYIIFFLQILSFSLRNSGETFAIFEFFG